MDLTKIPGIGHAFFYKKKKRTTILTGKRSATIEFCQVRHVVHKLHQLTTTRILRKKLRLFEFMDFCLSGMLAYLHEYFNYCHLFYFFLSKELSGGTDSGG